MLDPICKYTISVVDRHFLVGPFTGKNICFQTGHLLICWQSCRIVSWSYFWHILMLFFAHGQFAHSNHMTSSKPMDTLICQATMRRNVINFLYNPGHVTLWCLEVVPVVYAWMGQFVVYPSLVVKPILQLHIQVLTLP